MGGDPAGLIGFAEITTGFGFSSSGPALAHFGLAGETAIDVIIELPMKGVRKSLNVSVAFGVAVYEISSKI